MEALQRGGTGAVEGGGTGSVEGGGTVVVSFLGREGSWPTPEASWASTVMIFQEWT